MYSLMRVEKRNGNYEDVSFDKILKRIQLLCNKQNISIVLTSFVILIK